MAIHSGRVRKESNSEELHTLTPFGLARMSTFPVAKWILREVPGLQLPFKRAPCWGKSFSAVRGMTAKISREKTIVAPVT